MISDGLEPDYEAMTAERDRARMTAEDVIEDRYARTIYGDDRPDR